LNPGLHKRHMNPNGPFNLVVPVKGAKQFTPQTRIASKTVTSVASAATKIATTTKPNTNVQQTVTTQSATRYQIKKGDNIEKIAKRYNTTPKAIQQLNGLPNDVVVIGKVLQIPTRTSASAATQPKTTTSTAKYHVVKRGESLPLISEKHRLPLKELLSLNGLSSQSTVIQPGQRLKVSAG
jgi:membrane-bound lytic murein transglycosylase D